MNKYSFQLLLIFLLFSSFSSAQSLVLKGRVTDVSSGEPLIGATVKAGNEGVFTDFDGNFLIYLNPGAYDLEISYVGYDPVVQVIVIDKDTEMDFEVGSTVVLQQVEVVADIAIERETPVAFSNIPTKKLDEELAGQELPMVLNSTPGAYATQTGGGDGDARITIRGFDQRNIAVMLDGIPVNDMENGRVFWSNWFGLDLVTQTMQVQRGLGASKLAVPSVGGTINILTKGIDSKKSIRFKQEVGNNGFLRSTFGYNSGRMLNGWGLSVAASYKRGRGWVDGNFTEGYFYYLRVDKEIGNHRFSFSGFGAPQEHGQRSFTKAVGFYNTKFAASLFEGNNELYQNFVDYNQGKIDEDEFNAIMDSKGITASRVEELNVNFIDTTGQENFGLRYNEHWGYRRGEVFNGRKNYYHKPQFNFRHSWQLSERTFLSSVAYLSLGNGGGTSPTGPLRRDADNLLDFDYAIDTTNAPFGLNPQGLSNTIIRSSVNNHFWTGLLSTLQFNINPSLTFSGGIDGRYYRGDHYREVYDLLGGTGFRFGNEILQEGDRFDWDYTGFVKWIGGFALMEYKTARWSTFLNVSAANSDYKIEDHVLDAELDWESVPTYTLKLGANFNINNANSVFVNTGYLTKAQRFNNVIITNIWSPEDAPELAEDYENERISAVELGYSFKSSKFSANLNTYYTVWDNKPLDRLPTVPLDPNDAESDRVPVNINGIAALHKGIELDFAFKPRPDLTFEGLVSIGDWIWNSSDTARVKLPTYEYKYQFDAKGVHVGDAAQYQFGGLIRYEPIRGLYFKLNGTHFARNFANFQPEDLRGMNSGRESWQMPNYTIFSFHTGYSFKFHGVGVRVRANILNLFDEKYVSDARNNDDFNPNNTNSFDANSASVHFGQGRRWTMSMLLTF